MPGSPPIKNERAGNDAAAEHAIEFSDAGRNANVVLWFDLGERNGGDVAKLKPFDRRCDGWLRFLFDE